MVGDINKFSCPAYNCKASFTREFNLNRHYERFHMNNDIAEKCLLCGEVYINCNELQKHYKLVHKPSQTFMLVESAFKKSVVIYRYTFKKNSFDLTQAQRSVLQEITTLVQSEAAKKTLIKVGLIVICQMSMMDHVGGKMTTTMIPFRSTSFLVNGFNTTGLQRNILRSFSMQERDMEEFCDCDSNWVFEKAIAFDVEIAPMKPILVGQDTDDSTTASEILTEDEDDDKNVRSEFYDTRDAKKFNMRNVKNNKFLFNPANYDDKCFLYCVFKHLKLTHPQKKYRGWSFKKFEKTLNTNGILFPISIPQIEKFCKLNPHLKLKINIILMNTKHHVFPLEYGLGRKKTKNIMNLLLIQRRSDANDIANHFLLITNIHKFLRKTYHDGSYQRSFTCLNCLNGFSSQKILEKHEETCSLHKPRLEIVSNDEVMTFKNYQNQHPLEYIAFLDFECVLPKTVTKCPECTHLRCKCDRSFTESVADQHPITYSLVILDQNNEIIHKKTHSAENAADHLIDHLLEEENTWIKNLFDGFVEMALNKKDWNTFHQTTSCYLCNTEFTENVVKCRDHCHFTGKFLGAACQPCNLRRRKPRKLNIFLHNGSKYDFHFIVKALNNKPGVKNINILPYNGENFRTISFNSFLFVDSMSFLQNSLAKLSDDLSNTDNNYSILRQTDLVKTAGKFDPIKYKMVLGKSFFPYEYW
jgi:hypothetical protein